MARYRVILFLFIVNICCKDNTTSNKMHSVVENIPEKHVQDDFEVIAETANLFPFIELKKINDRISFNNYELTHTSFKQTNRYQAGVYSLGNKVGNDIGMYPNLSENYNRLDIKFANLNIEYRDLELDKTLSELEYIGTTSYEGEVSFIEDKYVHKGYRIKLRFEKSNNNEIFYLIRLTIDRVIK
ncbi:hypothetical protein [Costertonia aggregata]|uniref:Uncharacterized protein n=1 Tax=Costertonia aggregata TaxID=343403 RepID=A0A7H9AM23_9FLAO|nr:hypothetical protein [Costertonia aggregata]QLG44502.1 hypothetical protein HYG79_03785 [Costertonia aggregata]